MRLAALALLAAAAATDAASAEDAPPTEAQLKAVQQQIDAAKKQGGALDRKAHDLAAQGETLRAQEVASAHMAQEFEARLNALDAELVKLSAEEKREQAELAAKSTHEQLVLAALQRLTMVPPAALAMAPGSPIDIARGAMLMGTAVPALAAEAGSLAQGLQQLQHTRDEIARRQAETSERQAALEVERQRIRDAEKQRAALEADTRGQAATAQKQLAALTSQASDLKDLLARIERERAEAEKRQAAEAKEAAEREAQQIREKQQAAAAVLPDPLDPHKQHAIEPGKTQFQLPATGTITKRWGDPEGFSTSKGLTIATRNSAQIVAPFEGRIEFAGPFKGYGQILIIDHGGGYHSLLAGIDRLDCVVGQWVVSGEPLGTMQPDGKPSLYLELRRQGQPIDPLPWLAAHDGKASG